MKNFSLFFLMLAVLFTVMTGRFEYIPDYYYSFEWKQVHFSLLNIHGGDEEQYVNTAVVGYFFILLFALVNISRAKKTGFLKSHLWLTIITLAAILFELSSYLLLYKGEFHGIHIQIGLVLVIWSLWLVDRIYGIFRRAETKA